MQALVTMKRLVPIVLAIAAVAVLCWAFPPIRIHSLKEMREAEANKTFNAADFAATVWTEKLLPAAEGAAEADAVLDAIAADPSSVRDEFGRTVGMGSAYFLFLRGSGRVVSVDEFSIGLSLEPDGDEAQIVVERGFVFGNAVRDATGLIDASSYPNAQEFNDVSAELNGIVEKDVLPQLEQMANVGDRIQFVGCVEVGDEDLDLKPLKLVPILVKPD